MITGRCLCGSVRFEVGGPFGPVRYCHCTRCRRATGTAFSSNARVPTAGFAITAGRDRITEYELSPGVFRAFCSACGSPVYGRLAAEPESMRVRLGTLDADPGVRAVAHVWVANKAEWFEITDALPRSEQSGPQSGA